MMTSDDKVGGWVKKGQNHDDVILECPLRDLPRFFDQVGHQTTNAFIGNKHFFTK